MSSTLLAADAAALRTSSRKRPHISYIEDEHFDEDGIDADETTQTEDIYDYEDEDDGTYGKKVRLSALMDELEQYINLPSCMLIQTLLVVS